MVTRNVEFQIGKQFVQIKFGFANWEHQISQGCTAVETLLRLKWTKIILQVLWRKLISFQWEWLFENSHMDAAVITQEEKEVREKKLKMLFCSEPKVNSLHFS